MRTEAFDIFVTRSHLAPANPSNRIEMNRRSGPAGIQIRFSPIIGISSTSPASGGPSLFQYAAFPDRLRTSTFICAINQLVMDGPDRIFRCAPIPVKPPPSTRPTNSSTPVTRRARAEIPASFIFRSVVSLKNWSLRQTRAVHSPSPLWLSSS